jgi:PEP-CTERM motif
MRKLAFGLIIVLCVTVFVPPVLADFVGPYDVGNWDTTLTSSPPGGGSIVDTSGAPASIEIVGGDLGCSGVPCNIDFTIAAVASGLVSFDWGYETTDDPTFEHFGLLLNGFFTQLSDDSGGMSQSGSEAFAVSFPDVFGFRLDCTDCSFGPAFVTISNFSAPLAAVVPTPVPEPSTLLLIGTGLASAGAWSRTRWFGWKSA